MLDFLLYSLVETNRSDAREIPNMTEQYDGALSQDKRPESHEDASEGILATNRILTSKICTKPSPGHQRCIVCGGDLGAKHYHHIVRNTNYLTCSNIICLMKMRAKQTEKSLERMEGG